MTVTFLINRFPSRILNNKTPYEIFFDKSSSYTILRSFGCLYFASSNIENKEKFEPRATPCVFMGYPYGKKGYKLLDLKTKRMFVSMDDIFHENSYPFSTKSHSSSFSFSPPIFSPDYSSIHSESSDFITIYPYVLIFTNSSVSDPI